MEKIITTPVLFMVFNRPDKTQQVFNVIREVKPTKLYIAADAPRTNNESDEKNCKKVREIVSQVDWDCDFKFLFHENNLGCSLAGKTAWDWLFSQEEKMIFIEDDGLVSKSFFWYAQELLEKYQTNDRVAYIGGVNYGPKYGNASYFFSKLPAATYSMATWKRVYHLYEYRMDSYKETRDKEDFKRNFPTNFAYRYLREKFDYFVKNGGNTYDVQMNYLAFKYNMLSVYPNINLSSNIGLDSAGANNNNPENSKIVKKLGYRKKYEINEIHHPKRVEIDFSFEKKFFIDRIFWSKKVLLLTFVRLYFPFFYKTVHRIKNLFTY